MNNVLAVSAEFDGSAEDVLPPVAILESAKAYRDNKAKPLFNKILKVLRSVKRAYLEMKDKYRKLAVSYDQLYEGFTRTRQRLEEVITENDALKLQVRDYDRIRRFIGPDQTDELIRQCYDTEKLELDNKRMKRRSRFGLEL